MPRNGSGNYSLPAGNPVVTGTTISSTWANNTLSDIATGLTNSLAKDGQTTPTANIPMGGFKLTGLGSGSSSGDSANLGQIQDQAYIYLNSVSGTDSITANTNPVTTDYAAGQTYRLVAAGTNTGASTIDINGLGAKDIKKSADQALQAGDLVSGAVYEIVYDGTEFLLVNPSLSAAGSVTSASLADSALGFALINGTLSASVASNALTIAIKTKAGADPSADDPVLCVFRNAALATGDYVVRSITAATSLVISSGSTLGSTNGVQSQINVLALDNAGTVELAATNNAGALNLDETGLISTTAEGGVGGADSINTIYSTTARSNVAYRNIGYVVSTQATAGAWASGPTQIQLVSTPPNRSSLVSGQAIAATSGTSIDFTGIPSWVKRITAMLSAVSTSGTTDVLIQLGDSGGIENAGYAGVASRHGASSNSLALLSAGVNIDSGSASAGTVRHGQIVFDLLDAATNTWTFSGAVANTSVTQLCSVSGSKALSGTLDRIRFTTSNGTDTFDAGSINILYE